MTNISFVEQFARAIEASGLRRPPRIVFSGKIERFSSDGTKDKNGWYIVYNSTIPVGFFGCWKEGLGEKWKADTGREYSAEELAQINLGFEKIKKARDAEVERRRTEAKKISQDLVASLPLAEQHPYFESKGINLPGSFVDSESRLVCPIYNEDNEVMAVQYIYPDGTKRYLGGSQTGGGFWWIGDNFSAQIFLAEGAATAASINRATGCACFIAFSANNLPAVAHLLRKKLGDFAQIIVVGDNDKKSHTGERKAQEAADAIGARMVLVPVEDMDANDYETAGYDLKELLLPKPKWSVPISEFCRQPEPIQWIVKNWLPAKSLAMIHGTSGAGKTFIALDLSLRVASGVTSWMNENILSHGPVLYLAGEGHSGLRGRIAAWMSSNGVPAEDIHMNVTLSATDLNTPKGYLKAVEELEAMPTMPILVVVDTLHRFFDGDENSAKETKSMLDSCGSLITTYGCTVLLVHHTGLNPEAQGRGRGSSAWRAAMDTEISVSGEQGAIKICQRKMKDSEEAQPIWCELESTTIPGWIGQDGSSISSAVVRMVEAPDSTRTSTKAREVEDVLGGSWVQGGKKRDYIGEDGKAVSYILWSDVKDHLIVGHGKTPSAAAKQATRILQEAEKNKLLTKEGETYVMNGINVALLRQ